MLTLKELATWLTQPIDTDAPVHGFSIDTRNLLPGDVFVALQGEHVDGHTYIPEAVKKGAVAILCHKPAAHVQIPQFVVKDVVESLGFIARKHRDRIDCPVIALTGSNGKTTVKEMIASCLPQPALATQGNLNNHLGVPLMVLRLRPEHRFAVFELGANHIGEIAYTAGICKPDVALINNIAPAHIEGFGSIDGVAKAKGEIYTALPKNGIAIVNDDDTYHHFWDDTINQKRCFRFSLRHKASCHASDIQWSAEGCAQFTLHLPEQVSIRVNLQLPGEHMVANALAAASCLWNVGITVTEIAQGLSTFRGVKGRQSILKGLGGARIIDDSYNANLRSVLAGVAVLAHYPGKRILVLGDMGELGDNTVSHHQQIGEAAKEAGIDALYTVGQYSRASSDAFGEHGYHFFSKTDLLEQLTPHLSKDTSVLVKGSRSAAMETIVHNLTTQPSITEG